MKLSIIAHPNSKKLRIETDLLGKLHVHVKQPPLKGQANQAVIKALAKHFQVKTSQIRIISGHQSKTKLIAINN